MLKRISVNDTMPKMMRKEKFKVLGTGKDKTLIMNNKGVYYLSKELIQVLHANSVKRENWK